MSEPRKPVYEFLAGTLSVTTPVTVCAETRGPPTDNRFTLSGISGSIGFGDIISAFAAYHGISDVNQTNPHPSLTDSHSTMFYVGKRQPFATVSMTRIGDKVLVDTQRF